MKQLIVDANKMFVARLLNAYKCALCVMKLLHQDLLPGDARSSLFKA